MKNLIENKNQLINYILDGSKSREDYKIGIECESLLYNLKNFNALSYNEIKSVLESFNTSVWQPVYELDNVIGLQSSLGNISLEPAGQFEFSSNPCANNNDLNSFLNQYFNEVLPILANKQYAMVNLGFNPKFSPDQLPLMPKERYNTMYGYMPKVGSLGRSMMKSTCTLQANFDFSNEEDLKKKFRISMALQGIITAIYANSSIVNGVQSDYKSYRGHIWTDVDNKRAGLLDFVLDDNFSVEKYVDYALQIPMYFVQRDNKYVDVQNITFKDFLTFKYKFKDILPLVEDFSLHLSTLFPDVRLKTYLEVRGADVPDREYLMSLPALFTGLLYDKSSLDSAYDLIKDFKYDELHQLKIDVNKEGLQAKLYGKTVQDFALQIIEISTYGLKNRGLNEEVYLTPLHALVSEGENLSSKKLKMLNDNQGDVNKLINHLQIKN